MIIIEHSHSIGLTRLLGGRGWKILEMVVAKLEVTISTKLVGKTTVVYAKFHVQPTGLSTGLSGCLNTTSLSYSNAK